MNLLNLEFFNMNVEINISKATKTIIGIMPVSIGILGFCMGIEAISDINNVTTSSDVCSSLICLLPINRTASIIIVYKRIVRIKDIIIFIINT